MTEKNVCIIGAGLTGLTLAYYLRQKGIKATVLEARSRLGGRIWTRDQAGIAPVEMGATWLGQKHQALLALLQELNIDIFEQFQGPRAIYEALSTSPPQLVSLPENTEPSFRIKGGSSKLINSLASFLEQEQIQLNQKVEQVIFTENSFQIKTQKQTLYADILISTLPPNLLVSSIEFSPALPDELINLSTQTHTWMGESIKIGLTFSEPFWKSAQTSGTIFSNVGPISEMYDHSNYAQSYFALKGFLNGAYFIASKAERQAVVLNQLRKYYGEKIDSFQTYEEYVWRNDSLTFTDYNQAILPHQNNGHPLFRQKYCAGKLHIGGSETSDAFPGYMDGAVRSATQIFQSILEQIDYV